MKKALSALSVLILSAAMLTGCGNKNNTGTTNGSGTSQSSATTTTQSATESSPAVDNNHTTGDIDGDGFVEDIVTGAEDVVDDVVTGAEDIVDDILPGDANHNENNTANRTR